MQTKLKGKFNDATIFTDVVEDEAINQIQEICDFEPFKDSKIRVMPDVHSGKGCTIGTTMTIIDKIVPNMVGVDIGCGMEVMQIAEREVDFVKLDKIVRNNIPSGRSCRNSQHPFVEQIDLTQLRCKDKINMERAKMSIGSLGGGNHFIEMDRDDDGNLFIVIHSGSRHLGTEVASLYQKLAYAKLMAESDEKINKAVAELKEMGRVNEIPATIKKLKAEFARFPEEKAYLTGELFDDYIHDMKIVQKFAVLNRKAMIDVIMDEMGFTKVDEFTCIHNYIDTDNMILRKGAVSAQKGEKILIPINMRDGSLICVGKGNPEWNFSAPHGAGRLYSRTKAKELFSVSEFEKSMEGIFTTSVSKNTLDESPMAYKNIDDIVDNISETAEIVKQIKPVYNFKANE